jgi:serine protease Do
LGIAFGFLSGVNFSGITKPLTADSLRLDDQEATVRAIKKVMPAVVSIRVSETVNNALLDLNTGETTIQKENQQKGAGTGFLISADGLIITNKHVVSVASDIKAAQYRVILSGGKAYYAQLIGKDPINDLAILKIFDKNLPFVELGDSDSLTQGLTVIAIGNALGVYQNSVTKGVVSGLNRDIVASDQSGAAQETLGNVIQTDADINFGNSGGPLVDLNGKVVGINVAIDSSGKSIGFAIPINDAKPVIKSVREIGRIVRPRLGVSYIMITPEIAIENKLTRQSGDWISAGSSGKPAIIADSPAAKAGIEAGDIVIEIDGVKIEGLKTLLSIIQQRRPGQKVGLKIDRGGKIIIKTAVLDEFK